MSAHDWLLHFTHLVWATAPPLGVASPLHPSPPRGPPWSTQAWHGQWRPMSAGGVESPAWPLNPQLSLFLPEPAVLHVTLHNGAGSH